MKNLWSKEDIANFNNSEVFSELEARVLETIKRADILSNKISQAATKEEVVELDSALKEANKSAGSLKATLNSMNDDGVYEEESEEEEISVPNETFDNIINDLSDMAKTAIDKGDYKLAYKIERTIDELLEPEVKCQ